MFYNPEVVNLLVALTGSLRMISIVLFSFLVIIFKITTILCIVIYNIIINDDARLQNSVLLLKILMGTRKNFSKKNRLLGRSLSKRFANPALVQYLRKLLERSFETENVNNFFSDSSPTLLC
jgi:hypothetical protein